MHLFGKSAQWWLCFLLYNNLRRGIKSELENTELWPSQKLKLFSECVKFPDIWSGSKTEAEQGGKMEKGKRHGQCWNSFWQDAFIFWEIEILLIRLTRLQGACQALKSSAAVWWIRLAARNTSRHISPIPPTRFLHPLCNRNLFAIFLQIFNLLFPPSHFCQIGRQQESCLSSWALEL